MPRLRALERTAPVTPLQFKFLMFVDSAKGRRRTKSEVDALGMGIGARSRILSCLAAQGLIRYVGPKTRSHYVVTITRAGRSVRRARTPSERRVALRRDAPWFKRYKASRARVTQERRSRAALGQASMRAVVEARRAAQVAERVAERRNTLYAYAVRSLVA